MAKQLEVGVSGEINSGVNCTLAGKQCQLWINTFLMFLAFYFKI